MANILAYPTGVVKADDLILGVSIPLANTNGTPITKNFTASSISALGVGYQSYAATFSQDSTSAPVVTEMVNTTGLTFTWTRNSAGVYDITPSSTVTGKLWWVINGYNAPLEQVFPKNINSTLARFVKVDTSTGTTTDGISEGNVEIRIY